MHPDSMSPHRSLPRLPLRNRCGALVVIVALSLAYPATSHASSPWPAPAPGSLRHDDLGASIKHSARAAGIFFKGGAHRIADASKSLAHEIAMAAKRGANETRAAFQKLKP